MWQIIQLDRAELTITEVIIQTYYLISKINGKFLHSKKNSSEQAQFVLVIIKFNNKYRPHIKLPILPKIRLF